MEGENPRDGMSGGLALSGVFWRLSETGGGVPPFCQEWGTLHAEGEIWFEAEHAVLRFSAVLECHNDKCRESVAVCGTGGL